MKSVTKIILCFCLFCYFAGLWILATRFGLIKLIFKYGITQFVEWIPKDFPKFEYLSIGLVAYTVIFILFYYILSEICDKIVREQEKLQEDSSTISSYTNQVMELITLYKCQNGKDEKVKNKIQSLSRKIASLPPSFIRNVDVDCIGNIIDHLRNQINDNVSPEVLSSSIDTAKEQIESIKQKNTIIRK